MIKALAAGFFVCAATSAVAGDGPFGFERGMTRAQVVQFKVVKENGDVVRVQGAPKPHPYFEDYSLVISPRDGLLKIIAWGRNFENDRSCSDVVAKFDELKEALTKKYGEPRDTFDFLESGALWKGSHECAMSLTKKERTRATYWILTNGPGQVRTIKLEANGVGSSTTYLTVGYEFEGWNAFVDAKKSKANDNL